MGYFILGAFFGAIVSIIVMPLMAVAEQEDDEIRRGHP